MSRISIFLRGSNLNSEEENILQNQTMELSFLVPCSLFTLDHRTNRLPRGKIKQKCYTLQKCQSLKLNFRLLCIL